MEMSSLSGQKSDVIRWEDDSGREGEHVKPRGEPSAEERKVVTYSRG